MIDEFSTNFETLISDPVNINGSDFPIKLLIVSDEYMPPVLFILDKV